MAAHSLAVWLASRGHMVHVLTSAHHREFIGTRLISDNLTVERHFFPSLYQIYRAELQNIVMKTAWHAHDHFHLASERIVAEVIARVQPGLVNTHSLQGIGYNLLRAVARSGVPCVQTLHDFGFLCVNVNRFKDGKECDRHHLPCQLSTRIKRSYLEKIERLSMWSPSQALLDFYQPHLPVNANTAAIPLPLIFGPPKEPARIRPNSTRFLYVGQVTPWKGVAFLLEVISQLPSHFSFEMEVVGGGSDLALLEEKYQGHPRIFFRGKLPPENVGAHMAAADVLLTPSLWFENAPLVISQAIQLGLPVFASRIGGLPELVEDNVNGRLLTPGDPGAWTHALMAVLQQPSLLVAWKNGAAQMRNRFSTDNLGEQVVELFQKTIGVRTKSEFATAVC